MCGSDGMTYPNECRLKEAACELQTSVSVDYYGPCGKKKVEMRDEKGANLG